MRKNWKRLHPILGGSVPICRNPIRRILKRYIVWPLKSKMISLLLTELIFKLSIVWPIVAAVCSRVNCIAEWQASMLREKRMSRRMSHSRKYAEYLARRKSLRRNTDTSGISEGLKRQRDQLWIVPPFYRIFWLLHNISLVATPISFGFFVTDLYEGQYPRLSSICS